MYLRSIFIFLRFEIVLINYCMSGQGLKIKPDEESSNYFYSPKKNEDYEKKQNTNTKIYN